MRILAALALCLFTAAAQAAGPFAAGGPGSTDNDASCDISVAPAATLLLPFFQVDLAAPGGETTVFTITNTGQLPQAVQVTLWTDYDHPVIAFNLYLTGYDVQSVNLYDVLANGLIAPGHGTGSNVSPVGPFSAGENPLLDEEECGSLPDVIPAAVVARTQSALTIGRVGALAGAEACNYVGGVHTHAVGYATIDVVGACIPRIPTDSEYYRQLIRYDNVLIGDYIQVNGDEDFAQAAPMVHVRAMTEGGTAETRAGKPEHTVNSARTFYSRFQHASTPKLDARQPLPAVFAARWISGGATGFETYFKIWREGRSPAGTACSALPARAAMNMVEVVRFDEEENPEIMAPEVIVCTPIVNSPILPVTSLIPVDNESVFPRTTSGAVGGWMYLNLDHCNRDTHASQNWVISSMHAEGRFSIDADAAVLGNGCTLPISQTEATGGLNPIGPAPNPNP